MAPPNVRWPGVIVPQGMVRNKLASEQERPHAAARAFHTDIANFVKSGNPNEGDGVPSWRPSDPSGGELLNSTLNDERVAPWTLH